MYNKQGLFMFVFLVTFPLFISGTAGITLEYKKKRESDCLTEAHSNCLVEDYGQIHQSKVQYAEYKLTCG